MSNPFDYVNAINSSKEQLIVDDVSEKQYQSFLTNRSLSYFSDTVAAANVMNQYHHIDNKLQFDFLLNIVRKRKRFSKWIKADVIADLDAVKEYYSYSNEKAKVALSLLTPEAVENIKRRISRGGK